MPASILVANQEIGETSTSLAPASMTSTDSSAESTTSSLTNSSSSMSDALPHAFAGCISSVAAMAILYPLDSIRTRLQVQVARIHHEKRLSLLSAIDATAATTETSTQASSASSTPTSNQQVKQAAQHSQSCAESERQTQSGAETASASQNGSSESRQSASNGHAEHLHSSQSHSASHSRHCSSDADYELPNSTFGSCRAVVRHEGVVALYQGLSSALVGVAVGSAVYFYSYNWLKQRVLRRASTPTHTRHAMTSLESLSVATLSGVLNVLVTLPIWTINVRQTLARQREHQVGMWKTAAHMLATEGIMSFYRGLAASLLLVSNPAIQFLVYERCVHLLLQRRRHSAASLSIKGSTNSSHAPVRLSSVEFFLLGALAKAVATLCTYPSQTVKARMQASKGLENLSLRQTILRMWSQEGVASFYHGLNAKLYQTVLNSAFTLTFYEELVRLCVAIVKRVNRHQLAA